MTPIGHLDDLTRFAVSGWAGDADDPLACLDLTIHLNGSVCGRTQPSKARGGLEKVGLHSNGKYGFKYYFETPLSPFEQHRVEVSVAGSNAPLAPGALAITPVAPQGDLARYRPDNAVIVLTMGRSGGTLLMRLLSEHPSIVVGDKQPYEMELLTYYSYLFRSMIAPGDHEWSLRPDQITGAANRFKIGFNPYFDGSFRANFAHKDYFNRFLNNTLPRHLADAMRRIVLDFYAEVAMDKAIEGPIFLAEKAIPEVEIRQTTRYLFPKLKEVVLVRDLRDVLCSYMSFWKLGLRESIDYIMGAAQCMLQAGRSADAYVLRYEDLVNDPAGAQQGLFDYLGLGAGKGPQAGVLDRLFGGHGTSRSAGESIGRWRRDLTPQMLAACAGFEGFLDHFGYTRGRVEQSRGLLV